MALRLDKAAALLAVAPESVLMLVADVATATARSLRMFRTRMAASVADPDDVSKSVEAMVAEAQQRREQEQDFLAPRREETDDRAPTWNGVV